MRRVFRVNIIRRKVISTLACVFLFDHTFMTKNSLDLSISLLVSLYTTQFEFDSCSIAAESLYQTPIKVLVKV